MAEFYMDKRVSGRNDTGPSAQAFVAIEPHDKKALMIATAYGSATYNAGGGVEAGILVSITGRTAGVPTVVRSDSLQGRAFNVDFNTSTTLTLVVEPFQVAQIIADIGPIGQGGVAANHNTYIELHVVAIDI